MVYDTTKRSSFESLSSWLEEVERYLGEDQRPFIMIVGNKIDKEPREVEREQAIAFARENSALFVESSAKQGEGVDFAFQELVRKIIDTHNSSSSPYRQRPTIVLESNNSGGCCT
ncbi:hypothetical protein RCL1_002487 [Eukaryota sp. TZLM3-RCL]